LESLAFSSAPALIADKNRFSGLAFIAGAGDVNRMPDVVVGIHLSVLGGFFGLAYVHGSDESLFGAWVTAMAVCRSCRNPNARPNADCSQRKIFWNRQEVPSATGLSRVNFFSQFSRALEGDDFSLFQNQVLPGGRVSSTAFSLVLDTKFAETADQNIFTAFESHFDDLDETFNHLGTFVLGKRQFFMNEIDDLGFRQGHGRATPCIR
jgi:hypothetical protein